MPSRPAPRAPASRPSVRSASPLRGCPGEGTAPDPNREHPVRLILDLDIIRLGIIWIAASCRPPGPMPRRFSPRSLSGAPRSGPHGFSLVELLVVIALISVVLSIVLPVLARARASAASVQSISLQRQMLLAVGAYSIDNTGSIPYLGSTGDPTAEVVVAGFPLPYLAYFRAHRAHWASLIYPAYLEPREAIELEGVQRTLRDLGWPVERVVRTKLHMAECAFAAPDYYAQGWSEEQAPPPAWFRGIGAHEVVFPSSKGLLQDISVGALSSRDPPHPAIDTRASIGFFDGSAAWMAWVREFPTAFTVARPDFGGLTGQPPHQTIDGVRGRDWPGVR